MDGVRRLSDPTDRLERMFEVVDTHGVAVRRLATIGGQRRGGGSPGGRLRGRRAGAARAVAAASAGGGPAGVVEVAAHLRRTGYRPLRAELPTLPPGPVLAGLLDDLDRPRWASTCWWM